MNRFILSSLCVGVVAFAAEPVAVVRVACKARDRSGVVKAEAEAAGAAACLEVAHRKFSQSCTEGGLVAVSWSMDGELSVPCTPAKAKEDMTLPAMGRVRCTLSEKEGARQVVALEASAAICEAKVRQRLGALCTADKPVVATFTLTSTGDRLSCPLPEQQSSSR